LRKAGVWLGLIEDDDEYPERGYDHRGYDDYDEDEDEVVQVRPRAAERLAEQARTDAATDTGRARTRLPETRHTETRHTETRHPEVRHTDSGRDALRGEAAQVRSTVRPVARTTPSVSSETSYPTRDNLALAPQVTLRERPVISEQEERRYQITTLHPTTYHEARTVGEHFRDGVPVIMNLTEMAEADARRLVDFAAGLAFGLRGSMERVTNRVFLLSPANVQVTPEDKMKIAEGGFFAT
jgi:cell division inhibitor SepF